MARSVELLIVLSAVLTLGACAGPARRTALLPGKPDRTCADLSFPIYFEKSSDQLTASALAAMDSSVQQVKGCRVSRIEVLGLADADGPQRRNLELSRRRAAHVAKAIAAAGLPKPAFDIEAIGAAGARDPGGEPEPLRRRTEVVIHAGP